MKHSLQKRAALKILLLTVLAPVWGHVPAPAQTSPSVQTSTPARTMAKTPSVLSLLSDGWASAASGVFYSQTVTVSGGTAPYRFRFQGRLPAGLTWHTGAGGAVLSGTPRERGEFLIVVQTADQLGQTASKTMTLSVDDAHPNASSVPVQVEETIGLRDLDTVAIAVAIRAMESLTVGDLPNFKLPPTISPTTIPSGFIDVAYSVTFKATQGSGTGYAMSETGTLPTGLTVLTGGSQLVISGTPTQTGTFPFMISASDSTGAASSANYTLVITKDAQTITLGTIPTPTYADTTFALNSSASSGLPVSYEVLSGPATGTNPFTINQAGTVYILVSQAGNAQYAPATSQTAIVTISKASLEVTPGSFSRVFDGRNPPVEPYTVSGYVHGDNASVISGAPAFTAPPTGTAGPGVYDIIPNLSGLSATNYTFYSGLGTFTVTGGAGQTIFFFPLPARSSTQSLQLYAHSSSGLPVAFSVTGPATLSGSVLTVTGSGTVTVTASQAGNGSYAASTPVARSFIAP